MELRHLRYFVAVAEEGHITRAAERLRIQQPSLSVQIKVLEEEMGVPLLRRHARGVELTAGGQALLQAARAMLASAERMKEHVVRADQGMEGSLRVGFFAAWNELIPDVIRTFRRAYPQVALDLREAHSQDLMELTARGEIDVMFARFAPSKPPGIVFDPLIDEQQMLVLPHHHRLLKGKNRGASPRISLRALAAEQFVLFRRIGPHGLYSHLLRACQRVGFTPKIAAQVDQIGSILTLVAAEMGISVVGASMQRAHSRDIVFCRLDDAPDMHQPIRLVYLASNRNPAAANFMALAHERAAAFKRQRPRTR